MWAVELVGGWQPVTMADLKGLSAINTHGTRISALALLQLHTREKGSFLKLNFCQSFLTPCYYSSFQIAPKVSKGFSELPRAWRGGGEEMEEGERGLSYKALPPFFASARVVWLGTEKREFSERIPFRRSALFL